jgi:flagellar hook-basal body complex protein FliE
MAGIKALPTIQIDRSAGQLKPPRQTENKPVEGQKDFGQTITDFIKAVNHSQVTSDSMSSDIIEGRSQNLHQAMAAMEEAKLSFQLMMEIRNRLLDSFKEIQRLQV